MRAFLSKVLLAIFVVVFIAPTSLFAQENNWTPPVGGPVTGTNTPAPVNIGPNQQTKAGPLRVQGTLTAGSDLSVEYGSNLKGFTFFDTAGQGNDFMASFIPATFLNRVDVGQQNAGVDFNIFGRLKYKPTNPNGSDVQGAQPMAGYVLKSADAQGSLVWGPGMPNGGNDGDTLIWDETCNCWTTGPTTVTGAALPPGTAGQTLWFDNTTNSWQATNKIEHTGANMDTIRTNTNVTMLNSPIVAIGKLPLSTGTNETVVNSRSFNVRGFNTITLGSGGVMNGVNTPSTKTHLRSQNVVFNPFSPTEDQDLDIQSDTVDFGIAGDDYVPQSVTFNSSSVKFKGPPQHPEYLDAGVGRIPMSVDADGTFKWNKNLTYNQFDLIPGLNVGQLTLANPENSLAIFANAGVSWLGNDTIISDNGHLYLEGLEGANINLVSDGLVKHLCYIETDKKVVKCPTATSYDGEYPENQPPRGPGNGTVMYTVEDNDLRHQFNFTGTVTVKYCGGGGGGGGGGIGAPGQNPGMDSWGTGGSGGGGGEAGKCLTESVNVEPGSSLGWNIGQGGNGGYGAAWTVVTNGSPENNNAYSGQTGGTTSISFDPAGADPDAQVGQTVLGGFGGGKGGSVREGLQGGLPLIGLHGNLALATGSYAWGFNGGAGATINTAPCESCGGVGGWGEAYDSDGTLRTNLTSNQTSARGGGGTPGGTDSYADRFGRAGYCGAPGHGGGGGGGGFGGYYRANSFDGGFKFRGGTGGCGGSGYVLISGLPGGGQVSEIVFDTPGNHSLTQFQINNMIPSDVQNFTVELWGAGGGAGPVPATASSVVRTQGGGSGEYIRMTLPRTILLNRTFTVGAKGVNGSRGGTTQVSGYGSQYQLAQGGWGLSSSAPDAAGKGGGWVSNPGSPTNGYTGHVAGPDYNRGQEGLPPDNGGSPCNLAGENVPITLGFGKGEPRKCIDPTLNVYQGSAQDGRVRISW